MDMNSILRKWLKKAKLRNSRFSITILNTRPGWLSKEKEKIEFWYRGAQIGSGSDNGVKLIWPARLKATSPWSSETPEIILLADPRFFTKLRKAFKIAMADMDHAFRPLHVPER